MGRLFLSSIGYAEELPRFYTGIRPLGMGGAFTAIADDENALVYNPAGLPHRDRRGEFSVLLPMVEASGNVFDLTHDVTNISKQTNPADQTRQFTDLIGNNLGEHFRFKISLFPNLLLDRAGIGLLTQASVGTTIHNPLGSNAVEGQRKADLALLIAGAHPLEIRKYPLTIGVTLKGVYREIFDRGYTVRELAEGAANFKSDLKSGTGAALDLGFLYPLQGQLRSMFFKSVEFEPTLGLALQNILATDLGDAGTLPFQANLGLSLKQKMKSGRVLIAADIVDITRHVGEDTDLGKRVHMGIEYKLPRILALRTGLYQGYPTFGATLDLWIIQFGYAYYVEETGAFSGQIPNPRHVVKVSLF